MTADSDNNDLPVCVWADLEKNRPYGKIRNESQEKPEKNFEKFNSALSHDFRDPLAVILASLSILETEAAPSEVSNAQIPSDEKKHRRFNILLIEDNKDLTYVLSEILSAMGHQVHAVHNGAEGVTEARRIQPDVIFCDIGLPGLNGYDVVKTLKADQNLKNTFVIALTGYVDEYNVKQAAESGFDRFVAKPVDKAALERILADIRSEY
jgi:CheY-like chemotaxis protein